MARPTIPVPEETQNLVSQLRDHGKTLKQISRQTGLKYHVAQRILSQTRPSTVLASDPRTQTLAPDSRIANPQRPQTLQQPANLLNEAPRDYWKPNPPSISRRPRWLEPESYTAKHLFGEPGEGKLNRQFWEENETTKRLFSTLKETKLNRQIWDERLAGWRSEDKFMNEVTQKQEPPTFRPRPGTILYEFSQERYDEVKRRDLRAAAVLLDLMNFAKFVFFCQYSHYYWFVQALRQVSSGQN